MPQFPHLKSNSMDMNFIYNPAHKKFSLSHPKSNISFPILLRMWEVDLWGRRFLLLRLYNGPGVFMQYQGIRRSHISSMSTFLDIYSIAKS